MAQVCIGGAPVAAEELRLDDLGWDHGHIKGQAVLEVRLSPQELLGLGRRMVELARSYEEGEPDYFADPDLAGVPVMRDEHHLLDHPEALAGFLEKGAFWSREAAIALLEQVRCGRASSPRARFLIQDFRDVRREGQEAVVELGAWDQGSPGQ